MLLNSVVDLNKNVLSRHGIVEVLKNTTDNQYSLHTTVGFSTGDVICNFSAHKTHSFATYLTIQIDANKHITLLPEFLQYVNHSCDPTVFFDTTLMNLVCLKTIYPEDELTFFYPSTEWDMAQPFICNCGYINCLHTIKGACHYPVNILKTYRLSNFIKQHLSL